MFTALEIGCFCYFVFTLPFQNISKQNTTIMSQFLNSWFFLFIMGMFDWTRKFSFDVHRIREKIMLKILVPMIYTRLLWKVTILRLMIFRVTLWVVWMCLCNEKCLIENTKCNVEKDKCSISQLWNLRQWFLNR